MPTCFLIRVFLDQIYIDFAYASGMAGNHAEPCRTRQNHAEPCRTMQICGDIRTQKTLKSQPTLVELRVFPDWSAIRCCLCARIIDQIRYFAGAERDGREPRR